MKFDNLQPIIFSTLFLCAVWAFTFYVFSGQVDVHDAVVASLIGSILTKSFDILVMIGSHFFQKRIHSQPAERHNET